MIALLLLGCHGVDFADEVIAAPGADPAVLYGDPALAANGARGGGCCAGSTDVYSLTLDGARPELVLGFSGRVVRDGPGTDLVVYENPFLIDGGGVFVDPLIVGVSPDGERFVDFPHRYLAPDPAVWSDDPDHWEGFAGITPTLLEEPEGPADDPATGGDRFDLQDLPAGPVRDAVLSTGVLAVRLVPAGLVEDPATGMPYPVAEVSNGPDIDAVYAWRFAAR